MGLFLAADIASQIVLTTAILRKYPSDSIIAEEDASDIPRALRPQVDLILQSQSMSLAKMATKVPFSQDAHRFWTIDPIDGTKGFLRRDGQYAVCAALLERAQDGWDVVLGVLGCPALPFPSISDCRSVGTLFFAVKGQGAYQMPIEGSIQDAVNLTSAAHECVSLSEMLVCQSVEKGHSDHHFNDAFRTSLGACKPPLCVDSQCKYGLVARRDCTAFLRKSPLGYSEKIWDHAAGHLIATEAGGAVCSLDGQPIAFRSDSCFRPNHGIMAINGVSPADLAQVKAAAAELVARRE